MSVKGTSLPLTCPRCSGWVWGGKKKKSKVKRSVAHLFQRNGTIKSPEWIPAEVRSQSEIPQTQTSPRVFSCLLLLDLLWVYVKEGRVCCHMIGCQRGCPTAGGHGWTLENETIKITFESDSAVRWGFFLMLELRSDRKSKWRTRNHQKDRKLSREEVKKLEVSVWNIRSVWVCVCLLEGNKSRVHPCSLFRGCISVRSLLKLLFGLCVCFWGCLFVMCVELEFHLTMFYFYLTCPVFFQLDSLSFCL